MRFRTFALVSLIDGMVVGAFCAFLKHGYVLPAVGGMLIYLLHVIRTSGGGK